MGNSCCYAQRRQNFNDRVFATTRASAYDSDQSYSRQSCDTLEARSASTGRGKRKKKNKAARSQARTSRRSCCMMLGSHNLTDETSDADQINAASSMPKTEGGRQKRKKKKVTIKETSDLQGRQQVGVKDEIEDLTAQWIDASSIRKPNCQRNQEEIVDSLSKLWAAKQQKVSEHFMDDDEAQFLDKSSDQVRLSLFPEQSRITNRYKKSIGESQTSKIEKQTSLQDSLNQQNSQAKSGILRKQSSNSFKRKDSKIGLSSTLSKASVDSSSASSRKSATNHHNNHGLRNRLSQKQNQVTNFEQSYQIQQSGTYDAAPEKGRRGFKEDQKSLTLQMKEMQLLLDGGGGDTLLEELEQMEDSSSQPETSQPKRILALKHTSSEQVQSNFSEDPHLLGNFDDDQAPEDSFSLREYLKGQKQPSLSKKQIMQVYNEAQKQDVTLRNKEGVQQYLMGAEANQIINPLQIQNSISSLQIGQSQFQLEQQLVQQDLRYLQEANNPELQVALGRQNVPESPQISPF